MPRFVDRDERLRIPVGAIVGLLVTHLAAAVTLGTCIRLFDLDSDSLFGTLFIGLTFAQAGLIGLWCEFGAARWWLRLVGLVIGTALLAGGFSPGINEYAWQTYYIFVLTTTVVAAGLAGLRLFRFRLILSPRERCPAQPLQFGIRHLLALTLLTAIVVALALHLEPGLSGFGVVVLVTLFTLPFIAIALVAPWALLGQTRRPLRSAVLFVVTAVAALGTFLLLREIAFTWMLLAEASLLSVSLLIVRFCGYRLVRLDKGAGRV